PRKRYRGRTRTSWSRTSSRRRSDRRRRAAAGSGELPRRLDDVVGGVDLPGAFLGERAHAFRQAAGGELVGVVLAHQPAVRPLDLGDGRGWRDAQRGVGILDAAPRRRPGGRRAATGRAEQRLELADVALRET